MKTKILVIGISLLMISCGDNCDNNRCNEDNSTTNIKTEPFTLAQSVEINETQFFKVLSPKECIQKNKNRFIYQVMHDSYLWSEDVPQLDYNDDEFNTSESLLKKLRSPKDIFSYIEDAKELRKFYEGEVNNFGLGIEWMHLDKSSSTYAIVITHVSPNSPAHKAKFKRGDIIDSINNQTITDNSIDAIEDAIFNKETVIFGFYHEKKSKNITLTREKYNVEGILYSNQYQNIKGDKKIGYLVFQTFIDSTIKEINKQFNTFKKENIDELILDLRYNGGGSDEVANHLASFIGGSNVAQNIFHHVQYNEKYTQRNTTLYFKPTHKDALNLDRVFIITTGWTCSASELVINALRASANNMEVIQIGTTTCGKPYGFDNAGLFCDKALSVINMETKNSDEQGGYINGFKPNCEVEDNIFKSFGDTEENSLAEALYYIESSKCSRDKDALQEKRDNNLKFKRPRNGLKQMIGTY